MKVTLWKCGVLLTVGLCSKRVDISNISWFWLLAERFISGSSHFYS